MIGTRKEVMIVRLYNKLFFLKGMCSLGLCVGHKQIRGYAAWCADMLTISG